MTTEAKTKWVFDPAHTEIAFKVKHLMVTYVRGIFKEYDGNILTNGDDFTDAGIEFHLNPTSIETGEPNRDAHLRSADFFEVDTYPVVTFVSTSFRSTDGDQYELTGDLTIKGITKKIRLDVEYGGIQTDPWGNTKAGFTLTGKFSRKEFGLVWNAALESGGVLVGEEVRLQIEVELTRQA